MQFALGFLVSSVGYGILTVLPLIFGVVFVRRGKGWVKWLGGALLCWSFLLVGLSLFSLLFALIESFLFG